MVNKVTLVGRLGKDPESKFTNSGTQVVNFSLATNEQWKDKETGEKQKKTEWHRIVVWQKLAEICAEYLTKGSLIYMTGRLQTREWQDKEGAKRWTTEIVMDELKMLGGGEKRERSEQRAERTERHADAQRPGGDGSEIDDSDIPF